VRVARKGFIYKFQLLAHQLRHISYTTRFSHNTLRSISSVTNALQPVIGLLSTLKATASRPPRGKRRIFWSCVSTL
jgi:hypothetical protein